MEGGDSNNVILDPNGYHYDVYFMKLFSIIPNPELDPTGFAQLFKAELLKLGYIESQRIELAQIIFAFEHPRRFSQDLKNLRRSKGLKVLLRFEPAAVNPIIYQSRTLSCYDRVLSVGGANHIGSPQGVLRWPYFSHPNPAKPNRETIHDSSMLAQSMDSGFEKRTHRVTLIVSNKVSWSRPSNYDLRRRLVLNSCELGISVFGMGWQDNRWTRFLKNFRLFLFFISQGSWLDPRHTIENLRFSRQKNVPPIEDKFDIIRNSKFHLVVENSSTYVSEKLLDAFVSGAIPIYIGPALEQYKIPENCVITPARGLEGVVHVLHRLDEIDIATYRSNIKNFLSSKEGLGAWDPSSVAQSIIGKCR